MPFANAGRDTSICLGDSIQLGGLPTGPSGATYQWSNSLTLSNSVIANPNASPSITTTYTVTVTDGVNGTATDQITITIDSLPDVDAGINSTICSRKSVQLGGSPTSNSFNASYKWSRSGTLNEDSISNPTATPLITSTYFVTVTNTNGCSNTDSKRVTLTPLPNVEAGEDQQICPGGSVFIGGNPTGPFFSSFVWDNASSLNFSFVPRPRANPSVTTTYTVIVTPPSWISTCTATDQITVRVDTFPLIDAGIDTAICAGSSVIIGGNPTSSTSGVNYKWNSSLTLDSTLIPNPTANPSSTETYTLTVTNPNTTCSVTDQVVVTINPIPLVDAGIDTSICDGSQMRLGGSPTGPSGASYLWDNATSLTNSSVSNPIATPTDSTTYTLTVTSGANCTSTDQITIEIDTLPFSDAGLNQQICEGSSVSVGGSTTGPSTSKYKWSNSASLTVDSLANPVASPISTTTYTVTVTDSITRCFTTDQVLVNVDPAPLADAGSNLTICDGKSILIGGNPTTNAGNSVVWSPALGLSSTAIFNPIASPLENTTYALAVTNNTTMCVNNDTVIVTVDTIPIASAGVDMVICENDTVVIGSPLISGITYLWDNASLLDDPAASNPRAFPPITTDFLVTVSNINGCSSSDQVRVEVNPLPLVDAGNDITICSGDTVILGGIPSALGLTFKWDNASSLDDINLPNPKAFPTDSTRYFVTVTDAFGCSRIDSVKVNVNPLPIVSFTASEFCTGNLTAFTDNSTISTGSILLWSWNFDDGVGTSNSQNPRYEFQNDGLYNIRLIVTSQIGCVDSIRREIEIFPLPDANAGADQEICFGDTIQIGGNPSGLPSNTFQWNRNNILTNNSIQNPFAFPLSTTIFTLSVTDQRGCINIDETEIAVNSLPNITTIVNQSICVGESVQLSANGANSYQWSPQIGLNDPFVSNPIAIGEKSIIYQVKGSDINGCEDSVSVEIDVFNVDFSSIDTFICFGTPAYLNPIIEGNTLGIQYLWTPSNTLDNQSVKNPTANTVINQKYVLKIKNAAGCEDEDSIEVKIKPRAGLEFDFNNTTLCIGARIEMLNQTSNSNNFEWLLNDKFISNEKNAVFEIDNTIENMVSLIGFVDGCSDTLVKNISEADFAKLSTLGNANVFTPNGDGVNDSFDPIFQMRGRPLACIDFKKFQVYNRWGKLVYETSKEDQLWEGSSLDGNDASQGMYFYIVIVGSNEMKGSVYLSR